MNCPKCEAEIVDGSTFCGKCGSPAIGDAQNRDAETLATENTSTPKIASVLAKFQSNVRVDRKLQIATGIAAALVLFMVFQFFSGAGNKTLTVRLQMSGQGISGAEGGSCQSEFEVLGGQLLIAGNVFILKDASGKVLSTAHVPDHGKYAQRVDVQREELSCEYVIKLHAPAESDNIELTDGETTDVWLSANDLATYDWDIVINPR